MNLKYRLFIFYGLVLKALWPWVCIKAAFSHVQARYWMICSLVTFFFGSALTLGALLTPKSPGVGWWTFQFETPFIGTFFAVFIVQAYWAFRRHQTGVLNSSISQHLEKIEHHQSIFIQKTHFEETLPKAQTYRHQQRL